MTTGGYGARGERFVVLARFSVFNCADDGLSADNFAEDDVFVIQVRRLGRVLVGDRIMEWRLSAL